MAYAPSPPTLPASTLLVLIDCPRSPMTDREETMAVPKKMQGKYDEIAAYIVPFCDEKMNDEYKELLNPENEKYAGKYAPQLHLYKQVLDENNISTQAVLVYYAILGGVVEFKFN